MGNKAEAAKRVVGAVGEVGGKAAKGVLVLAVKGVIAGGGVLRDELIADAAFLEQQARKSAPMPGTQELVDPSSKGRIDFPPGVSKNDPSARR